MIRVCFLNWVSKKTTYSFIWFLATFKFWGVYVLDHIFLGHSCEGRGSLLQEILFSFFFNKFRCILRGSFTFIKNTFRFLSAWRKICLVLMPISLQPINTLGEKERRRVESSRLRNSCRKINGFSYRKFKGLSYIW